MDIQDNFLVIKMETENGMGTEVEVAVAILNLISDEVSIDPENKRLEVLVSSSIEAQSQLEVKKNLDKMAMIFDCNYHSRSGHSSSGGYEDGFYYYGYEYHINEFKPKRITSYAIYVRECCSTSLL